MSRTVRDTVGCEGGIDGRILEPIVAGHRQPATEYHGRTGVSYDRTLSQYTMVPEKPPEE